jgi:hypothetical protein
MDTILGFYGSKSVKNNVYIWPFLSLVRKFRPKRFHQIDPRRSPPRLFPITAIASAILSPGPPAAKFSATARGKEP